MIQTEAQIVRITTGNETFWNKKTFLKLEALGVRDGKVDVPSFQI